MEKTLIKSLIQRPLRRLQRLKTNSPEQRSGAQKTWPSLVTLTLTRSPAHRSQKLTLISSSSKLDNRLQNVSLYFLHIYNNRYSSDMTGLTKTNKRIGQA